MSCVPFSGNLLLGCDTNSGGTKRYIYITDFDNVTTYTESGGTVSSVTLAGATSSYGFWKFEFNKNGSEYTQNSPKNIEAGSLYVEQTINVVLPRIDVTKRNVLETLKNRYLIAIVPDNNGYYHLVGLEEGLQMSELTSTTGRARADGSSYNLTLMAEASEDSFFLDPAILTGLIA